MYNPTELSLSDSLDHSQTYWSEAKKEDYQRVRFSVSFESGDLPS